MHTSLSKSLTRRLSRMLISAGFIIVWSWAWSPPVLAAAAPMVPISQVPMTVTIPAHPQILLAVANSQSMDGDLSGAIRTGSGSLGPALSGLQPSSSPVNYTIPVGFTPPANPGGGGVAPYTVNSGGLLLDNSASRMNVAKGGLSAILNSYISSADFALMDYSTSGLNEFTTWVYQMSQPGGFTFTSTLGTNVPGTVEYLPNPCYQTNPAATDPVSIDCNNLNSFYASQNIFSKQYLVVSASSDDPSVNDVLYAGGGIDPVCVVFGGPTPPTPFPPNYSLGNYNSGGVLERYSSEVNSCARATGPTNAGFVPYSTQVMYEQRGFGFYTFGEFKPHLRNQVLGNSVSNGRPDRERSNIFCRQPSDYKRLCVPAVCGAVDGRIADVGFARARLASGGKRGCDGVRRNGQFSTRSLAGHRQHQ